MKRCSHLVMALGISLFLFGMTAWAMPLHPDLMKKMQENPSELARFQAEEAALRARGVNLPVVEPGLLNRLSSRLDENFNMIAILLDFSDKVATESAVFFDTLLYGANTGSVNNYMSQVTYGNLTLVTLNMPSALGWKRAPQTYAYYVDGQKGFGTYPHNAQRMAMDAITLADPFVNFSNYDNDADGFVDALFIIHAGPGYELSGNVNDIHSHAWSTYYPMSVDGVWAYGYSTEPEYWTTSVQMTCGVYAHEMGHAAFGLPDLYDYGYDSEGAGDWSLMASGSWNGSYGATPAHPDAWCRIQMGAATATNITVNTFGASIPQIETTPTIYRLWTNGATGNEFFLVENRRRTGYDTGLPSQGLLIWHIDENQSGNDNQWYPGHTGSGHYLAALEQADGLWNMEKNQNEGDTGDPYPGSTTNRTFDSLSTPNSRSYSDVNTLVAVRTISNSSATMTADLYVNLASLTVNYPNGGETWYTGESKTITWTGSGFTGNVKIELKRGYPSGSWETLYSSTANDGSQAWTVAGTASAQCRVRISSVSNPGVADTSNSNFAIVQPYISVTVPDGGEEWQVGTTQTIWWGAAGFTGDVKIELNRTYSTGAWETLYAGTANDGYESWIVTGPTSTQARVRITSVGTPSITDVSGFDFAIVARPPEMVHDPLGDIIVGSGTIRAIARANDELAIAAVKMFYRAAGDVMFDSLNLAATGNPEEYAASLSSFAEDSYEYYVRAVDNIGSYCRLPATAPAVLYSFDAGTLCGAEITYDDGSAERYNYADDLAGVAVEWAVKFGPVQPPYILCGARVAISRIVPDTLHPLIQFSVYAADGAGGIPGTVLKSGVTGSIGNVPGGLPPGTHWAYIVLKDETGNPLVLNSSEFYVSVRSNDVGEIESFGRDTNEPNQHRSYFYDACESTWFSEDDTAISNNAYPGNRMIRVNGYSLEPPTVVINRVGDTMKLNWTGIGAPLYSVYCATAVSGPYTLFTTTADTFLTVTGTDTAAVIKFYEIRSASE